MKKFTLILILATFVATLIGCSNISKADKSSIKKQGYEIETIYEDGDTLIYKLKDDNGKEFMIYDGYNSGSITQIH